ncbi:type I restriction-modification system subunit M N-terminal domain-containing protein [Orbus wheelerorum]|uniref:type I restriction-modification system subunit M N-terminal domain-containing protein n=1 Tax=Orbus wheelerorum TaxID=3074111 RepID=UPI00370D5839
MTNNFSQTAAFLWSVADLLRGDFKQSQYGRIILPFTLLRRLECVLADSKEKVLSKYQEVKVMELSEEMQEKMLLREIAPFLEKLSIYARHLRPMLREQIIAEDEIDLTNVEMSHYRLSKIRQQPLKLKEDQNVYLPQGGEAGTGRAKDQKETFLSVILSRLNEVFITDHLTNKDMINYAMSIKDKLSENRTVMTQIRNNTREQAILGDFSAATDNAIFNSSEAHKEQMKQLLGDEGKMKMFQNIIFDLLVRELGQ